MAARRKMMGFVNWKVRVELTDTRSIVGVLMAFDKHMNIVMGDCEEIRLVEPPKTAVKSPVKFVEERRILGMILLRGNQVTSMKPEAPPAAKAKLPASAIAGGAAATAGPMTMQGAVARPMLPGAPLMVGPPRPGMPGMPMMMMPRPGMGPMPGMMPMGMMPGMMPMMAMGRGGSQPGGPGQQQPGGPGQQQQQQMQQQQQQQMQQMQQHQQQMQQQHQQQMQQHQHQQQQQQQQQQFGGQQPGGPPSGPPQGLPPA